MFFPLGVILNHMSRDLINYQVVSDMEKNSWIIQMTFTDLRYGGKHVPGILGLFWDALFRVVMEWQWIQRSELVSTFDFELGPELWNEFPYRQDTRLWLAGIFRWCVWFYVGAGGCMEIWNVHVSRSGDSKRFVNFEFNFNANAYSLWNLWIDVQDY